MFRLIDPTTPTGGFAHSNTLEAGFVFSFVHSTSLSSYIAYTLYSQVGMNLLYMLACKRSPDKWLQLDRELTVKTSSATARRASCLMGIGMLRAYASSFGELQVSTRERSRRAKREQIASSGWPKARYELKSRYERDSRSKTLPSLFTSTYKFWARGVCVARTVHLGRPFRANTAFWAVVRREISHE